MGERHAAQVRADADHDQPLLWPAFTRASSVCGSGRLASCTSRLVDLLLRAVTHEDGLAAPFHGEDAALRDGGDVHLGGGGGATVDASGFIWSDQRRPRRRPRRRKLPLQHKGNHGVSDGPPKTLSSRFQALSHLQPAAPPRIRRKRDPEQAAGARGPRGGRKPLFRPQSGGTSSPESFYWHPCRESASPLSARKRAMH